jgi:hypothetical protein
VGLDGLGAGNVRHDDGHSNHQHKAAQHA